jgi:hypothetical protein
MILQLRLTVARLTAGWYFSSNNKQTFSPLGRELFQAQRSQKASISLD